MFMFVQTWGIVIESLVIWLWQRYMAENDPGLKAIEKPNDADKEGLDETEKKRNEETEKVDHGDFFFYKILEDIAAHNETPAMWQKMVGFVWVYSFWYWIIPWTVNPLLRLGVLAASPLPFSLVEPIMKMTGTTDFVTRLILG